MTNTHNNAVSPDVKSAKKLYSKPTLAILGSVKQLTQTGSSTKADAQSKMQ